MEGINQKFPFLLTMAYNVMFYLVSSTLGIASTFSIICHHEYTKSRHIWAFYMYTFFCTLLYMYTWLFPDCQVLAMEVRLPNLRSYFCFYSCNYTGKWLLSHVVLHPANKRSFLHLLVERVTDLHDVTNPTNEKGICLTYNETD